MNGQFRSKTLRNNLMACCLLNGPGERIDCSEGSSSAGVRLKKFLNPSLSSRMLAFKSRSLDCFATACAAPTMTASKALLSGWIPHRLYACLNASSCPEAGRWDTSSVTSLDGD
ncbi:hypothetical protein RSOL_202460 [Rhizoctonia solani AG-3 Rhs1AP]|uniref:Uncharacterized protein n=2 Tax=Rhizoctonia solani AG-3 TaxID=1086053 RepID=A0A074SEA5_9AGAM|nr:hypothetical protein RSOL_202460 [Rhizoctonia solani AG-3 Rhs1AP]KEP48332.1 hypothetical protein V565_127270 [Rhizoctonia solani 123E]